MVFLLTIKLNSNRFYTCVQCFCFLNLNISSSQLYMYLDHVSSITHSLLFPLFFKAFVCQINCDKVIIIFTIKNQPKIFNQCFVQQEAIILNKFHQKERNFPVIKRNERSQRFAVSIAMFSWHGVGFCVAVILLLLLFLLFPCHILVQLLDSEICFSG